MSASPLKIVLALSSALLLQACLGESTSGPTKGDVRLNVSTTVPRMQALSKGNLITLSRLVVVLTSNATPADTVRDTITASTTPQLITISTADQTLSKTYTLKGLRTWSVSATVYDTRDSVIHQGTATTSAFLKVADSAAVSLNLSSRFAMYEARFQNLPDSVTSSTGPNKQQIRITRLVLRVNGVTVRDSSASPYFAALNDHVLTYDYVRLAASAAEVGVPPPGTVYDLNAIDFPNADTGYIAGSPGNYRSTNGGQTWSLYTGPNHNGSTQYRYVSFSTGKKGIWAGDSAYLISVNNGVFQDPAKFTTFTQRPGPAFLINDTGFAVQNASGATGSSTYRRTINGGVTWVISAGYGLNIYGLHCLPNLDCWAVGYRGLIRKNTGASGGFLAQQRDSATLNPDLLDVHFVDGSYGWAVGRSGAIVATTNGGTTWSTQTSGTSQPLNGVYFIDRNNGYAVGDNGTLLSSVNGGATWVARASGSLNHLRGISFAGGTGWVVGANNTVLRIGGVQSVEMLAYGTMGNWNPANPLFRGTRYVMPSAGLNDTVSLALNWVGPATGTGKIDVTIGKVGTTTLKGAFNPQLPKRSGR